MYLFTDLSVYPSIRLFDSTSVYMDLSMYRSMYLSRSSARSQCCSYFLLQVYEKAKAFTAVGAGLTLAPNGLSVIDSLGLYDKVRRI